MTLRNDAAVFGWAFMIVWMAMLLVFTGIFARDGGAHQFSLPVEIGILALFWTFGLFGCVAMFRVPRVELRIDGEGALLCERWLLGRRTQRFPAGPALVPGFAEEKDGEGDPYFRCTVTIPDGRMVPVAESRDRAKVEAVHTHLRAVLG